MTDELGFWAIAASEPDRTALIDVDGTTFSYAGLAERADQLAEAVRDGGVEPGDVVCALLPNSAEMVIAYLAAMRSGIYITPVNTRWRAAEIAHVLNDSGATGLIVDQDLAAMVDESAIDSIRWRAARGEVAGYEQLDEIWQRPVRGDLPHIAGERMMYTSGTTGAPKGVRRQLSTMSPNEVALALISDSELLGLVTDGYHLSLGPLYHAAPLTHLAMALHLRCSVVMTAGWDSLEVLESIERHRITSTHMVPTMFERLLSVPAETRASYDLSSLRAVVHAAAPCPVETKRRMIEWLGPNVYEYYAATEGGGTVVSPTEWLQRPGTVGRPRPGADVVILDAEGRPCAPMERGAVYIKPVTGAFEYLHDHAKTAAAHQGDYFTVGDLGYLDEEGYLFISGRTAEVIISGGVNIYPAEVEQALISHPDVADVAVLGVEDPEWGQSVVAVIETAPGAAPGPLLADVLRDYCRSVLADYKCPRRVVFTTLPRELTGKVRKSELIRAVTESRTDPNAALLSPEVQ